MVFAFLIVGFIVEAASIHSDSRYYGRAGAYNAVRDEIQDTVAEYADDFGIYPTVQSAVTIGGYEYKIIDICSLITPEGDLLSSIPDGITSINGSDNDNCDGGCQGCYEYFSYIWAIDDEGNVYSTCIGEDCTASGEDGYQDVWP